MRRIKNSGIFKIEGLIISLLKSEISNAERNHLKYFNNTSVSNNTNASNNTSNNTNSSNNTNDDQIRDQVSDIRAILSRLGDIVTKNDREKIKKELYEIENIRKTFQIRKKKILMIIFLN